MKRIAILAIMASSMSPAHAQTAPAPTPAAKPMGTCEALTSDWKRIEQNMADRFAQSIGDNSAPRATLTEMREANDLTLATMTVQFMRDNKCSIPKRAPNTGTYMLSALECATARTKAGGSDSPACNRETWIAK